MNSLRAVRAGNHARVEHNAKRAGREIQPCSDSAICPAIVAPKIMRVTFPAQLVLLLSAFGCTGAHASDTARAEYRRRVNLVKRMPGFVALWDFVLREPEGARRFAAHQPKGDPYDFRLDAVNYVKEYWDQGRAATYGDFPLLGRGPFGEAIQIRAEEDPDFRPCLLAPRARLHGSGLDAKGPRRSVSMVVWLVRASGNHAIAGIWHEGHVAKRRGREPPGGRSRISALARQPILVWARSVRAAGRTGRTVYHRARHPHLPKRRLHRIHWRRRRFSPPSVDRANEAPCHVRNDERGKAAVRAVAGTRFAMNDSAWAERRPAVRGSFAKTGRPAAAPPAAARGTPRRRGPRLQCIPAPGSRHR